MRVLVRPKVLLPILLAAALIFLALSLGDLSQVVGRIQAIPVTIMAIALGFAALYLALKALQLHLLLDNLGAHPDWGRFALAFAVGELAVTLPLGIFAENWVLAEEKKIKFGRSSAATVTMLLAEIAIVLLLLTVVGIPGWRILQPLAALVLFLIAAFLFGVLHFEPQANRLAHKIKQPKLHEAALAGIGLIRGLKSLTNWHVLAVNLVIPVFYLGALACAFLAVGHGVGLHSLDYLKAATIYAFSLAAVLLCGGLVGQIGSVEIVGMIAAQAWGIGYTDGLALMLGFRVVWTGALWLLNGPIVIAFWRSKRPHADDETDDASADHREKTSD
ncbi:MAG TPA: lysylphosphatidylglycerol synthase domain-containing protein [Gammaproteobacteria bacterium]|nr:lysylphosphatidylglycerol synthase domain-containing protein [Gammaproteobacteria bacterium]